MQKMLCILVCLSILSGTVYSCHPCKCGNWGWGGVFKNLRVGDCRDASSLHEIPNSLEADIEGLVISGLPGITSLQKNMFIKFHKLQTIYAGNDTIRHIDENAFNNMTNLKYVSLSNNDLTQFPSQLFYNTPNLTTLWAYRNKLTILQKNLFSNLPALKDIHLYKNMISVVEDNCFVNLPSLEIIDLSTNLIKQLQLDIQNNLPNLEKLYLYNNYWTCDESLCEIINAVVSREFESDKAIPTCEAPDKIKGKQWDQLELQDFTPSIVSSTSRVEEGDDIILQCKYCFISNVSWILNNRKISSEYHQIYDNSTISTMTFENVQKEESGTYSCHVKNCERCQDASIYVSVIEAFTTVVEVDDFTVETRDFEEAIAASCTTSTGSISLLLISLIVLILQ